MGQEISAVRFEQKDFDFFYKQLNIETEHLKYLIEKQALSEQSPIAGFEVEAWLLDRGMRPTPSNQLFLEQLDSSLASAELAKFNIELNNIPIPLTNEVLRLLHEDLAQTWQAANQTANQQNIHLALIGTMPTLEQDQLSLKNMSEMNRYRALNEQILNSRGKPIHIDISGKEHLKFDHFDVMLEAATTSFQIHTQVPFPLAHHYYNASIIASAPLVAIAANGPYLFGKDLWDETRIPLFEQAIETGGYAGAAHGPLKRVSFGSGYARESIFECFAENVEHFPILLPIKFESDPAEFEYLRLHNGTIWRWNRPLVGFDDDKTPHFRIENRTPAAGPSIVDQIANAAFYYGLANQLTNEIIKNGIPFPFSQAKDNFYQAARHGLNGHIIWQNGEKHRLQSFLTDHLIPKASQGLRALQIQPEQIDNYLGIIKHRVRNKQTGAQWQREFIKKHPNQFRLMMKHYVQHQSSGKPVSEWPL
ncbi:MAG: glutamate--cysteine ligase [Methylococcaceae bacterium]